MWHSVKDLSPDQRHAIESLLGRHLQDDEVVNIHPSRLLNEALTGEERSQAWSGYLRQLGALADRAKDIPDEELDAIIDEACDHARHSS